MTIRLIPSLGPLPAYYSASCARCGEHVADFHDPERADEAIGASGGAIVVSSLYIEDCAVACADCKDACLCPQCGILLERDICPNCGAVSVIACAVVIDAGKGVQYALGESTCFVWDRIKESSLYSVADVLYAGDDRNQAIQAAEAWNKTFYQKP